MSVVSSMLRNVAVIGHNETGKTTLVEQMLFYADVISRAETVASGKTTSDYTEEEIANQISIHASLASLEWQGKRLNIVDTPGTSGFIGETIAAFRATEAALMLVDGRVGPQIETIKLWRRLDDMNTPRAIFINKMDREHADYTKVLDALKESFKTTLVPVAIPMGSGKDFKGIINLIENKAYFAHPEAKETAGDIPAEYADMAEEYRTILIESAAEGADDLIEKYFEEMTLEADDIRRGLQEGLHDNRVVPVLCGSSEQGSGLLSLLNFISNNFPDPLGYTDTIIADDGSESEFAITEEGTAAALVFKTTIDQFSGKLSFVKVLRGTLKGETELYNAIVSRKERANKVYRMVGKKIVETSALTAGDVGVIAKSNISATNYTLVEGGDQKFSFKPIDFGQPTYSLAISSDDKKSEEKMNEALHRVSEEDLTFQIKFNEETKENVVAGMGDLHLNMILDKVREKQKINIHTKLPRVAYRETIRGKSGIVEYTHKKQSGGHGQYGRVLIEIEPLERGEYYSFTNAIKGVAISKGYIPGIEKGLHEQMEEGFLAGYPMMDIGISLVDGKEHPVDSSEMAFKLAAKGAMKLALAKAVPVLLEPIVKLNVYIEEEYLGDILSDLSTKRGRVLGQEDIGHLQMVRALVPQSELLNYAIDLKSMTSGTGSFEMEFDHYEPLTGKGADEVVKAYKDSLEEA
ncbi:MAG TPA: elongation factor G [Sphaerochaeta sp.]|jgi:elongation factor G|nr:elongation factor G [Spirochaetota bacterium]NLV61153.1 elongation factor G [Spirochaetales bacterium]HOE84311.1 elongation factor G [Sphaerochaeta sp.]HOQ94482.1 elongation factor G [Sphaerochaeta sp.]HPK47109.1 elongation factor G [Sphaerochaeta sp.]